MNWRSSPIMFKCQDCDHEYLVDISNRGYTVVDVAMNRSDNFRKFWSDTFKCPKCNAWNPPKTLVFDQNADNPKWTEWLPKDDEDYQAWKEHPSEMLILYDYKSLLPNSKPNPEILNLFKKHNCGIEVEWTKHKFQPNESLLERANRSLWELLLGIYKKKKRN